MRKATFSVTCRLLQINLKILWLISFSCYNVSNFNHRYPLSSQSWTYFLFFTSTDYCSSRTEVFFISMYLCCSFWNVFYFLSAPISQVTASRALQTNTIAQNMLRRHLISLDLCWKHVHFIFLYTYDCCGYSLRSIFSYQIMNVLAPPLHITVTWHESSLLTFWMRRFTGIFLAVLILLERMHVEAPRFKIFRHYRLVPD